MFKEPLQPHATKKIGVIVDVNTPIKTDLTRFINEGLTVELISSQLGEIDGKKIDQTFDTTYPVLYDAIYVDALSKEPVALRKVQVFIDETYNHYKTIGFNTGIEDERYMNHEGVVQSEEQFIEELKKGRHFNRPLAIG